MDTIPPLVPGVEPPRSATLEFSAQLELAIQSSTQPADMSELAYRTLTYIAASTRLSPTEKQSLIRLTALIDHYAGGSPKLFRQLAGVIQLMESQRAENTYPSHRLQDSLESYQEWRKTLKGQPEKEGFRLSVELEISLTYKDWLISQTGDNG